MKQVSDKLFVAQQLAPVDIIRAKAKGFAAIINNRPDREEPGQPSAAEMRKVAEAEGLIYSHIPVTPGKIDEQQLRAFQKVVSEAGGPVLAHCKTGTRSATLYAIGEVLDGRMNSEEVAPFGRRIGLDLSGAVNWLNASGR